MGKVLEIHRAKQVRRCWTSLQHRGVPLDHLAFTVLR
jgi:hypothetical protein